MCVLCVRYGTVRAFDASYPQPKSKPAPIERDEDDDEDEEEYEELLAEASAKRDRLSERLVATTAASGAAAAAVPSLNDRPNFNSYPSPLTEHSFSQDSDMY